MRKFFFLISIILTKHMCFGQNYQDSAPCHWNVNDADYHQNFRRPVINATFTFGHCTGTLINRDTDENSLGFYFLTARHCVSMGAETDVAAPPLDFDTREFELKFNYQSSDENSTHTPSWNQGHTSNQSNPFGLIASPIGIVENGYEYIHKSKIELIDRFFWGDFALCRIVTPIPPHFNVEYAGWNPNQLYNGFMTDIPLTAPDAYIGIHHPKGDIKKVSGANYLFWMEQPQATGCYSLTMGIDLLFGWMWDNTISTQVICNVLDVPWFRVPQFNFGSKEQHSSGSGFFNTANQLIGVLSGIETGTACDFGDPVLYGKLRSNYFNASVKNILNPNNNLLIDIFGMESRKVSCYPDLELPGAEGVSGHYFAAAHYQEENAIVLQAANSINITQPIVVYGPVSDPGLGYSGADYTFRAGYDISGTANLDILEGANFTAEITPCSSGRLSENSHLDMMLTKLSESTLPKKKVFDRSAYHTAKQEQEGFALYPNPTTGIFTLTHSQQLLTVEVYDPLGRQLLQTIPNTTTTSIDLSGQPAGIYIIRAGLEDGSTETHRVVLSPP